MWKSHSMSASQLPTARLSSSTSSRPASTRRQSGRDSPPLVLGRYRLARRLGTGGFGTVWLAHDERLERDVAVKVLGRERIVGGRFEREARATARLSHPGIVTLYEAAVDDDGAYLVSELVRGETLERLLEAGRLSDRDIVEVAVGLCDALSYAHSQQVIHRDVKPSNVLMPEWPVSSTQLAKLTDFGVARVIGGDSLTRTGDVVGTAAYMAPEQAEGRQAGAAADLYSLALVIYEALTGLNPLPTGTAAQRARRLGAHLPPLRRQRRELPRELGRAIDLALRPRPRERGTVEELRAALIEARPGLADTPGVVARQWPARHPPELPEPFAVPATADHADDWRRASLPEDELGTGRATVPKSARALAALATAGLTAWLTAHALAPSPIPPAAAAVLAAVLVAALPRIGWLLIVPALALGAGMQARPGAAVLILTAGLTVVPLLPRDGAAWPLPAGAPALGLLGLAGAWPAIAARAGGPWRRAVLGGAGWIWLVLATPLYSAGLYLRRPPGMPGLDAWSGSLHQTVDLVLRPMLSSGALAAAPVWALASLTLPWLVRGRSLVVEIVLVTAWAATVVSATTTAIMLVAPGQSLLAQGPAVLGAIFGAGVVLAPGILRASRVCA